MILMLLFVVPCIAFYSSQRIRLSVATLRLSTDEMIHLIPANSSKEEALQLLATLKDADSKLLVKDFALAMKDNELEKSLLKVKSLEKDLIQANSACTSRGIFEFALKASQDELGLAGHFNAKKVCTEIENCK